ncbi:hypothetical protein EST38_g9971 [Candolleomyces aberdarensis]|uniref:Uncharacterized protein n=1 Tax=Candolleomyces aberdarensis TaxID=2316362 RepID=A0A4Q2D8L0_9AGAR|nr:hypothetical protein EST38_g9971 [Candolleomyces aberdarensis]
MASSPSLDLFLAFLSRIRTRRATFLILFGVASLSLVFFYTTTLGIADIVQWLPSSFVPYTSAREPKLTCSPREYSQGKWVEQPYYTRPGPLSRSGSAVNGRPDTDSDFLAHGGSEETHITNFTRKEDIFNLTRFQGCASIQDYWWHFSVDQEERWDRFPRAVNWEWIPGGRCNDDLENGGGLRDWDSVQVLKDMLEQGGWLMLGDSITENHFFSLSCLLYPHVIARPQPGEHFDRAWPQHLYLNPASPLLQNDSTAPPTLHLPEGFDIAQTPLATYRRVDLLWSTDELQEMHRILHPEFYRANWAFKLFGTEAVWTISPHEYLNIFTQSLPVANYGTMILSTAGHWTTGLFAGYQEHGTPPANGGAGVQPVYGYDGLLQFFGEVMERWAPKVQAHLDLVNERTIAKSGSLKRYPPAAPDAGRHGVKKRRVIVRAYLPGHDRCHTYRSAVEELQPIPPSWNWAKIPTFNQIFEDVVNKTTDYPDIHFLPIDLPGRFRPDGHVRSDCLHIMTGVGVLEGWSHYIWHYLTREI